MKKTILLILLVIGTLGVFGQTPIVTKKADPVIKDTVIKGTSYQIYQGAKGGTYIFVTSKTTGTIYKRYFKAKGGA